MSTPQVGDRVRITHRGTVKTVEPSIVHHGHHFIIMDDGKSFHVAPSDVEVTEPKYEIGQAYEDRTGRVYVRTASVHSPWLAPSGTFVSESRPSKPMRKLVPEA